MLLELRHARYISHLCTAVDPADPLHCPTLLKVISMFCVLTFPP